MEQHSVTKSQALLQIGSLCHLLHSLNVLVWKRSKIMKGKGSSLGNQTYLNTKLPATHYSHLFALRCVDEVSQSNFLTFLWYSYLSLANMSRLGRVFR